MRTVMNGHAGIFGEMQVHRLVHHRWAEMYSIHQSAARLAALAGPRGGQRVQE